TTLLEAAPKILRALGTTSNWDFGALWLFNEETGVLGCHSIWSRNPGRNSALDRISLARAVYASGKPLWVADILETVAFAGSAAETGLHGACAFLIGGLGQACGVMEFFSSRILAPDEELTEMYSDIGVRIGNYEQGKRAERALRISEERYRQLFENVLTGLYLATPDGRVLIANPALIRMLGFSSLKEAADRDFGG